MFGLVVPLSIALIIRNYGPFPGNLFPFYCSNELPVGSGVSNVSKLYREVVLFKAELYVIALHCEDVIARYCEDLQRKTR